MTEINIDWIKTRSKFDSDEAFKQRLDSVTDDTVIPFLAQAGFSPDDGPLYPGDPIEDWTDTVQGVLSWICVKDERFEKTLFAALHDHIRSLDGVRNQAGEKMYLVCKGCGEAFDDMQYAHEHGTFIPGPDPSWCGENGFDLVPESEAL